MKKLILSVLLSVLMICSVGCSGEPEPQTHTIESIGLSYQTPAEWNEYLAGSLYRRVTTPKDMLAMVEYSLISEAGLLHMSQSADANPADYLLPICAIVVCDEAQVDSERFALLSDPYAEVQLLSEQGSYEYYGFWYYDADYGAMSDKDYEDYCILEESAGELMSSVTTTSFDPQPILDSIQMQNSFLTFSTSTFDEEPISSLIFGDYDMTMVYFYAGYCLPDLNELSELAAVYDGLKAQDMNVELLLAAIDTPDASAEATLKAAMEEAGCEFDAFRMDSYIGTWVVNNLEALPSTVFVDKYGELVGETIRGMQGAEYYNNEINIRLPKALAQAEETAAAEAAAAASAAEAEN